MKEHFQDYGVRKWAGDDLIELQAEPLDALQALVAPYAPCILKGCGITEIPDPDGGEPAYRLMAGFVALKGRKTKDNGTPDGGGADTGKPDSGTDAEDPESGGETTDTSNTAAAEEYVKIVRVPGQKISGEKVFLALKCTPVSRAYANGENKAIAYDYTADVCDVMEDVGDRPYLEIHRDETKNRRLLDALDITKKLDAKDGNAKDVVVTFPEPTAGTTQEETADKKRPRLVSGSRLGLLMEQIRRWFDELKDLKAMAFRDKVAMADLDTDLAEELEKKVKKEDGYGLSKNDFDDDWMRKLDGIENNANKYELPTAGSNTKGGIKTNYSSTTNYRGVQMSGENAYVYIPTATNSATGLMSSSDKTKLNNIDTGANKTTVDASLSSTSTNPVQNKIVYDALNKKLSLSGGSMTGSITYPTTNSTSHSRYISTGGGYGKNVGKNGLKLLFQDQSDAECGFGSDLTGYTYEACFATSHNPSNTKHAYITFAKHKADENTYTRLAEIDGSGNFRSTGLMYEAGARVATQNYVSDRLAAYPRVIAAGRHASVHISGTTYLEVGNWSSSKTATGTYTVSVPGVDLTQCVVLVTALGGYVATLSSQGSGSFIVNTYKDTTLKDCPNFYFVVLGF